MPSHPAKKKKKKTRMLSLKMDRISGVDHPAQEGAVAVLLKRHDKEGETVQKQMRLLSSVDGHSHLIFDDNEEGGHTSFEVSENSFDSHWHPWIRNSDGSIRIGEADGHKHRALMVKVADKDQPSYVLVDVAEFNKAQTKHMVKAGVAMKDGTFPILGADDMAKALEAFGECTNKTGLAKHIQDRASALGLTGLLSPEGEVATLIRKAATGQGNKEAIMADKDPAQVAKEELEKLQKRLDRAEKVADLTDEQKGFMKTLGESEQASFLEKSPEDRQSDVEKARAEDPIVYTATDGREFRKSVDENFVAEVKRNDDLQKRLAASEAASENSRLEKRAKEELPNLPGDEDVKIATVKALEGIPDEKVRAGAFELIKAGNTAMTKAFDNIGDPSQVVEGSAEQKLDKLATDYAKQHDIPYGDAYIKVLRSEEGDALYEETIQNDRSAAKA